MSKVVFCCWFKLKEGTSVPDFLLAGQKLNDNFISKQKGYLSWDQMVDGDTWADAITFDSMESANSFMAASSHPQESAKDFYSFIDMNSCMTHMFSVERSHS